EALRAGGGKRRNKKEERVNNGRGQSSASVESSLSIDSGSSEQGGVVDTVVPDSQDGGNLEIVLPFDKAVPPSGINLLLPDEDNPLGTPQRDIHLQQEASKLLVVQKSVGFCYDKPDGDVIKELVTDEVRDRAKKSEWEHKQGYQ
ncbi:hypothetical protein A2U01_0020813, partial [Trifolium medium]|nr:hypothetical protein [Trifolium medium]